MATTNSLVSASACRAWEPRVEKRSATAAVSLSPARQSSGAGVQLHRHARHAAEQRVVQLAGDAGALREHRLEPRLGALRGQACAAALPRDRGEWRRPQRA